MKVVDAFSSRNLLDELEARARGRGGAESVTRIMPTIRKLSDPMEDIEDLVAILDDGEVPELRPNEWLARNRTRTDLTTTDEGIVQFEGRACCVRTMYAIERRYHQLPRGPVEFACDTCGAQYVVELAVR